MMNTYGIWVKKRKKPFVVRAKDGVTAVKKMSLAYHAYYDRSVVRIEKLFGDALNNFDGIWIY